MIKLLAALVLLPLSAAAKSGAFPAFQFTDIKALRSEKFELAAPPARPADVVIKSHMHIQAGKEVLFGYADTYEQFAEAAAHWTEVLRAAGIQAGTPTYAKDSFLTIPYKTADGRIIRDFTAEPRQFPPKDENGLRANMALAKESLAAAGLTPVSARVLNLEFMLPTYSLLYLTQPETAPEHERRIRVLKPGGNIDADLIARSGVAIVQQPEPWLLVYVGPELGLVGLWAKTPADLADRLERRKAHLVGQGKKMIGEKFYPIEHDEYKYGVDLLFFQ